MRANYFAKRRTIRYEHTTRKDYSRLPNTLSKMVETNQDYKEAVLLDQNKRFRYANLKILFSSYWAICLVPPI